MALELWETLKDSNIAYTGLSPATFFTVVALGIATYVISGMFGSSSDQHHTGPRDFAEEMQPLSPPVQQGDVTDVSQSSNQIDSSSSSPPRWNVFLSFRGKDTRKTFTSHLYSALDRAGIRTFMDDPELPRGEEISPQLLKAIQESKVCIVVFSKNYASSPWCLNELEKILECKRTLRRLVLPVFYDVNPSVVRHQTGSFAEAFKKHKKRFRTNMEIVEKWKGALIEAADLSGYDLQNEENGYEAKLIQKIIQKIQLEVDPICMDVAKHPVGIESRVECITPLLSIGTNDIRRIGIYGMGGIGKTTIAKALFNENFHYFEGSCFLANVREASEEHNGILRLQEQLLSDILKVEKKVENVDKGISLLKERLCSKKVLIVLDDLDNLSQSYQLAGQWNQFASGSRIIITTRDISVLDQIEVEERYDVKELDGDESFELFSRHAFKTSVPSIDYMKISKGIVHQAGGLPLALEVLGSYLSTRPMTEWRSSLDKLRQIPRHEIQEKLKISYDALGDGDLKDVFLDIACFFIEKDKEKTIRILDSCGFDSENEITILIERCLVSINNENKLRMHDLLRDMGREIVKKESSKEPEKRSRLWSSEDICNVLKNQKGTEAIEGIIPYKGKLQEVTLNTKTFKKMHELILLDIKYVRLTGNFRTIFEELRWLSWKGCDLQCLPSDFLPKKLVILDLYDSKINILWHDILVHMTLLMPSLFILNFENAYMLYIFYFIDSGCLIFLFLQFLKQLKILNLDYCKFLTTTPDFTGVSNLEKLHLYGCERLADIHPSIGHLSRLVELDLKCCGKLRTLPSSLCNLRVLESLDLSGCEYLEELPKELGNIESLKVLDACGTAIIKLPESIGRLSRLVKLDLKYCGNLRTLSSSLCNLRVLESLYLNNYGNMEELPKELGNIESLKVLEVCNTAITKLPDSIGRLSKLINLDLESCTNLRTLPSSLCNLRVLESLCLNHCNNLKGLPEELGNIESLRVLKASFAAITKLPDSIGRLTKLLELNLALCEKLKNIPSSICKLPLRKLDLSSCEISDGNLLDDIGSLSSLKVLNLSSCKISNGNLLDNIGSLSSLKVLRLSYNIFSTLPSSLGQLSNLKQLILDYCWKLQSVQKLPPNLETLSAVGCISMERLPDLSNLKHLASLDLLDCSRLVEIQSWEKLNSITDIDLRGCGNLAITLKETIFQACSGSEKEFEIYLPTEDCPEWFGHQTKGRIICFEVPQNSENKFVGMILWVVVSSGKKNKWTKAIVENKTNGDTWNGVLRFKRCSWVIFIPKARIAVKFGDKIEASIRGQHLMRVGVHLVYKTDTTENY